MNSNGLDQLQGEVERVTFFSEDTGFAVLRVPHAGMIDGANGMTDYSANTVAVREDMRGVISGKAADAGAVVALLDDLRRNAAFRDVKLVHMREAGGESRQIAYAVSLVFVRRTGAAADDGKAR